MYTSANRQAAPGRGGLPVAARPAATADGHGAWHSVAKEKVSACAAQAGGRPGITC